MGKKKKTRTMNDFIDNYDERYNPETSEFNEPETKYTVRELLDCITMMDVMLYDLTIDQEGPVEYDPVYDEYVVLQLWPEIIKDENGKEKAVIYIDCVDEKWLNGEQTIN